MKIDDIGENQMAIAQAEGMPVFNPRITKPRSETARLDDNLTRSNNSEGEHIARWRGVTVWARDLNFHEFGQKCRSVFPNRLTLEKWSYNGRAPKLVRSWAFDSSDKAGTAIGHPPGEFFAGYFGLAKSSGAVWVDPEKPIPAVQKAIQDDLNGD